MCFRAFLAGIHCGSADLSRSFPLFFQLPFLPRVIRLKLTRAKPIPSFHLFSLVDCVAAQFFKPSSSKGCCVCTTAGIFSCSSLSERSRLLQKRSWVQQPADPDTARGAADWGEAPERSHHSRLKHADWSGFNWSPVSTGRRATNSLWGLCHFNNKYGMKQSFKAEWQVILCPPSSIGQ